MTQTKIITAIYTKISSTPNLPQKVYENVPTDASGEYLEIFLMPLPNQAQTFNGGELKSGLVQINVVVPTKTGTITATEVVDLLLETFKNGTKITEHLKVSKPSYASNGITDELRYIIPVTIQYQNMSA